MEMDKHLDDDIVNIISNKTYLSNCGLAFYKTIKYNVKNMFIQ